VASLMSVTFSPIVALFFATSLFMLQAIKAEQACLVPNTSLSAPKLQERSERRLTGRAGSF
jgi:hypothetical protein